MDSKTSSYIRSLQKRRADDDPVFWHLRGLTRLLLRSLWCDLHFLRALGVPHPERNLTQKNLSEVTETLTSTVDVNKKGNLVKPLTELSRHLDQWTAFIHPQKEVALWNLNKIEHCRSQVAKVAGRRSTFEKCRIEGLEPALLAFSRLAESAPSTYYQLGKSPNPLPGPRF